MGKQSRLRKARKLAAEQGGLHGKVFRLLKPEEAFGMNANTGKISIEKRR